MRSLLHATLVVLTLLSQIVGAAAVLCIEGDGGVLVEFQLGEDCCESEEGPSAPASATPDSDDCGTCQDLSLAQLDRVERDSDDLSQALDLAATLIVIGFPCAPQPTTAAQPRPRTETVRAAGSPGVRTQVAETVVLTC